MGGVSRWEQGHGSLTLNKKEGRPPSRPPTSLPLDLAIFLLAIPDSGFSPFPNWRPPRDRQRNSMAGRSVNFVFARHSQPVRSLLASPAFPCRAPSGNTRMNTICRHLVRAQVFSLSNVFALTSIFPATKPVSQPTVKCDGNKKRVAYGFWIVRVGWVATSRHARRAQRHLECGVQMVPFGLRVFSKMAPKTSRASQGLAHPV